MKTIKIDAAIIQTMSDDCIKQYYKKTLWNGEYLKTICKNCGEYVVSIRGDTDNCIILNHCVYCRYKEE